MASGTVKRINAAAALAADNLARARMTAPTTSQTYDQLQAEITALEAKGDADSIRRAQMLKGGIGTTPDQAIAARQAQIQAEIAKERAEAQAIRQSFLSSGPTIAGQPTPVSYTPEQQAAIAKEDQDVLIRERQLEELLASPAKYQALLEEEKMIKSNPSVKEIQQYERTAREIAGFQMSNPAAARSTTQPYYVDRYYPEISFLVNTPEEKARLAQIETEKQALLGQYPEVTGGFNPKTLNDLLSKSTSAPQTFSSDKFAIGGGVLGAGDDRGVVVSISAAEEKIANEKLAKSAGYTKGATVDPRIGVFKPVDSGILTPGLKATPSADIVKNLTRGEGVIPQRARKAALTTQPDSQYANPKFVNTDNVITGGLESGKKGGSVFQINLTEGQPRKPRQLTQDEVNALSPAEYENYRKEIDAYNAWVSSERKNIAKQNLANVLGIKTNLAEYKKQGFTLIDIKTGDTKKTVPIDFAYKNIVSAQAGAVFGVSSRDPLLVKQRQEMIESRKAQKKFIREAKESGGGFVSIKSATGTQVVPIDFAYKAIAKAPSDAVISTKLPVSEKGVGPDSETRRIAKYQAGLVDVPKDPLSQTVYKLEAEREAKPYDVLGELGLLTSSEFAAGLNLVDRIRFAPTEAFGTDKEKTSASLLSGKYYDQAKMAYPYELAVAATKKEYLKETDIGFGIKAPLPTAQSAKYAFSSVGDYMRKIGPTRSITQGAYVFGSIADPSLVPIRQVRIATALETRVPTIIGAPKITSKVEQVARGIKIGYSPEVSRLELVKIKDGPIKAGIPAPESIPQLERVRGLPGRGGYPITEDVSSYMTHKPTLDYLVKKGILTSDEAGILAKSKPYLTKSGKYPDEVIRTELPPQPILSLEQGPETTAVFSKIEKESFKKGGSLGALFGSITEQFYVLPKYLEQSRDIDLHPTGKKAVPESQRISREIAQEAQDVARPERQFAVKESWGKVLNKFTGKPIPGKTELKDITISVGKSEGTNIKQFAIKPDYDETMWIGKKYEGKKYDPDEIIKTLDGGTIVFRGEPGRIRASAGLKEYELRLDKTGLTTEQYQKWLAYPKENPGVARFFYFSEQNKLRLFVAPSYSVAEYWYGSLRYGKTLAPKPHNVLAIKIKPGAVLEKDVNVYGSGRPIDKTKPTVFASQVDILTPDKSEWIILNEDVIEDVASVASKRSEKLLTAKPSPLIKPDYDEVRWIGKDIGEASFYHGTPLESAKNILRRGFTFSKAQTSPIEEGTIFLAREPQKAIAFAAYGNIQMGQKTKAAVLKITADPNEIADIYKLEKEAGRTLSVEEAITIAKQRGFKAIDVGREDEIQVLSSKFFKSIRQVGVKDPEWKMIRKLNIKGGRIIPGTGKDVFTSQQTTKRKIIEGEEFDTKVSEFIVKPMDERGGIYGNKTLDPNKVMGFEVPSKETTVKGVKIGEYTGKQKIQSFRRQELRRISAAFELQFEKTPTGSLRADPGREKEYAKIYAIAKTREAQALKAGNMGDAKYFSGYAEDVKTFAEKRGIWKTGSYVGEVDDSGATVKPPLKERAASSAIAGAKDVSQKPILPVTIATPRSETFTESRSESPRPPSTTSRYDTSSLLKYSMPSDVRPSVSSLSRIKSQVPSKVSSPIKSTIKPSDISSVPSSRTSSIPSGIPPSRPSAIPSQRPSAFPSRSPSPSRTPSTAPSRMPSLIPSKIPSVMPRRVPTILPIRDLTPIPQKPIRIPTIPFIKTRQDKTKKNEPKGRVDFFGSSHITNIEGFRTKKKDFDYGDVKTARLAQKDIFATNRQRGRFVKGKRGGVIPSTKPGIISPWKAKTRGEFSKGGTPRKQKASFF